MLLQIKQKTEALSKEKMLAMKNNIEYEHNANDTDEKFETEQDYMADVPDFYISTATMPKDIVGDQQAGFGGI